MKEHVPVDSDANVAVGGDVRMFGCRNCIVHNDSKGIAVIEGLDGYIVAKKGDNILVCRLSEEQHIKEFSELKR